MDVFTSTRPIYTISKLFGQATYDIQGHGHHKSVTKNTNLKIYAAIVLIATISSSYALFKNVDRQKNDQQKIVLTIFLLFYILLIFSTIIRHIIQDEKIIDSLVKLQEIDVKLKSLNLKIDYTKEKIDIFILIFLQYLIFIMYYTLAFFYQKDRIRTILDYVCLILRKNVRNLVLIQVEIWMSIIKKRFMIIYDNLKYNKNQILTKTIRCTAILHRELCQVTNNINSFYSVSLLISAFLLIVSLLTNIYKLFLEELTVEFVSLVVHYTFDNAVIFMIVVIFYNKITNTVSIQDFYRPHNMGHSDGNAIKSIFSYFFIFANFNGITNIFFGH